jgi:hypothetical protein
VTVGNHQVLNLIWFLQIQRCAQQKQPIHDCFKEHNGGSTPHTTPCECHLHKCNSFSQKNSFASDFLENALVTLHFHPTFSIGKKHSLLYGKQWISWISMYGQIKCHLATCTPGTSNAFCNLFADSVGKRLSGTTFCHHVSLGTFTMTPHYCMKWICRHFTPDNSTPFSSSSSCTLERDSQTMNQSG